MESPVQPPMGSDEQVMIQYLLGELPEEERAKVQERLLSDESYFDRMLSVECDLMDAYVRGELSPEQKERFNSRLLGSTLQREKLEFSDTLRKHLNQPKLRQIPRWAAPLAAMLVLASGCAYLFWQNQQLRQEAAELHAKLDEPPQQAPAVFSFALIAGQTRAADSASPSITIPQGTQFAQIQLIREEPEPAQEYAVRLKTVAGRERWRQEGLSIRQEGPVRLISVWLPTAVLTPGKLEVDLLANNKLVDTYSFQVAR